MRNYLSRVQLLHLLAGKDISLFKSYELTIILKGLKLLAKHVPSRAPPITPDILLQLVSLVDFSNPPEVTFMSAFLFTFFLLARVSNIVPHTSASFNPSLHLYQGDMVLPVLGSFYSSTLRPFSLGNGVFCYLYYVCQIPFFVQCGCLSACVPLSWPLHHPLPFYT